MKIHSKQTLRLTTKKRAAARGGFTLIEILGVIVIIGILMAVMVTTMGGASDVVHAKNTRMFLDQVATLLVDFEGEMGDFPDSTFPGDLAEMPSQTNMGAEMMLIALYPAKGSFQADDLPEDRLGNTDGDSTKKSLTNFSSGDVFELVDDWENPVAYIHRRDYGKSFTYVTIDPVTGELIDNEVTGVKSSKTGDYFNRKRFQLISAGSDGEFGTRDDIANFKQEEE